MKNLKNNSGFTLVEVLLAMGILTLAVTTISDLQFRSLFRVLQDREDIERIFLVKREVYKNFWSENLAQRDSIKKEIQTLENPELKLTTEILDINPKSSLKAFKDKIKIINTSGEWKSSGKNKKITMVGLVFRPKKEEQEKKQ